MKHFERGRLHDTNVKTVILRLDYAGVVDSILLNKLFVKRFPKAFKERQEIHNNEFNIQLRQDELRSISKSLSVPINVIEKETIIRYKGMRDVACDVTLDISQYYLCMTIKCENNYDGLDKYLECFKGTITVFSENVDYFQPKRLGIRKIRVEAHSSKSNFKDIFENFVFDVPSYDLKDADNFKTEYFDFFEVPALNHIRFNIHRTMDKLEKQEVDGTKRTTYQAVLDIDAYYRSNDMADINKLLTQANNEEYKVYLYCMKECYLRRIYRE
jgi:uncharacterized protein (TIGR04255 family)